MYLTASLTCYISFITVILGFGYGPPLLISAVFFVNRDLTCYISYITNSGRYYGHNCANRDTSMKFGIKVD